MSEKIIIGPRDQKRRQAILAAVVCFVVFGAFLALTIYFAASISSSTTKIMSTILTVFSSLISLIALFVTILTILNICLSARLKATPCIEYNPDDDTFVLHPIYCKATIIKNGSIVEISNSTFYSFKELRLAYKDEKNNIHRLNLGLCENISKGVLRSKINKYHKPEI